MEVRAQAKNVRGSAAQGALVPKAIKGSRVEEAVAILRNSCRSTPRKVEKSAAERGGERREQLQPVRGRPDVFDAHTRTRARRIKRFRAGARVGPFPIHAPLRHITIVVEDRRLVWDTKSTRSASAWAFSPTWQSKWYADKDYTELLHEDLRIRQLILARLSDAASRASSWSATPTRSSSPSTPPSRASSSAAAARRSRAAPQLGGPDHARCSSTSRRSASRSSTRTWSRAASPTSWSAAWPSVGR